jgi:(p)ppGpp synthase/HD superfamily hydrolase
MALGTAVDTGVIVIIMTTKQENPKKVNWWLNELESLGVSPKVRNELNDIQETSNLAENLKQVFYQAYKEAYNEDNSQNSSNVQIALI